jgi:hypothetical protein
MISVLSLDNDVLKLMIILAIIIPSTLFCFTKAVIRFRINAWRKGCRYQLQNFMFWSYSNF